jgi:hypothetical protein
MMVKSKARCLFSSVTRRCGRPMPSKKSAKKIKHFAKEIRLKVM